MKTDVKTLSKIIDLHAEYVKEVEQSGMKPLSVEVYKINSYNFIRWIKDEYHPGSKIKKVETD